MTYMTDEKEPVRYYEWMLWKLRQVEKEENEDLARNVQS